MSLLTFLAPAPFAQFTTRFGGPFTADANAMIYNVPAGEAALGLLEGGCAPLSFNPSAVYRDLLDGGDFTVAPWQRNIPGLASGGVIASAITTTPTYFADRWFHVAGAGGILVSKVTDASVPGYNVGLKTQRQSGSTDTTLIQTGQVMESPDVVRTQGQYLTLSVLVKAGANFSGAGLNLNIIGSSGVNQSSANLVAGSWTAQATLATSLTALTPGYQKITLTTNSPVPASVNQLAVTFTYTPTGTAGADDSFTILDTQLELGTYASPFERREAQVELELAQRYAAVFAEPASGVFVGAGNLTSATNASIILPLPVQLWRAPVLTGLGAVSLGTFKVAAGGTVYTPSALAGNANHTPLIVGLTATISGGTTGQGVTLQGGGGSGYVVASADF